ncbi:MAG: hypothetical protein K1563_21030 [Candidatus Thiodiazotropha sp. (ex. Lucinisca nassula)]|nr:hypothetical protein [Candidatus Thiodiazotropha sp. (ex. Lucinisca nassula)]
MLNENGNPYIHTADDLVRQIKMGAAITHRNRKRVKGSIRELERLAANLRRDGDCSRADVIDLEIMALLDKKICRKIIKRSRKEQKLLQLGPS